MWIKYMMEGTQVQYFTRLGEDTKNTNQYYYDYTGLTSNMKNHTDEFGSHIGFLIDKTYYIRIIYTNINHIDIKDASPLKLILEVRSFGLYIRNAI